MVYRIYVKKKQPYAIEAASIKAELVSLLGIEGISSLCVANRYDVESISQELFEKSVSTIFSEPPVDNISFKLPEGNVVFAVEYLPGQFDQRADSAAECIQLISQGERPIVRSAKVYILNGDISSEEIAEIKKYVINPVEAREASLEEKYTLKVNYPMPKEVETIAGMINISEQELTKFVKSYALAMDAGDLAFCQNYFKSENRDPTITELRMIDTYWSDHCRHTTFGTVLSDVSIDDENVKKTYEKYLKLRERLGQEKKPITLMDIATIGAKALKAEGLLKNLDESDEINACSIEIKVDNGGKEEDWLLLFKNETHNHPTEIEPFGGAATCIGGAIRDPLANRGYVFGAMRVTGAGNPLLPVKDTLPGKLPQRKLVTGAAQGYSSYGNQIGLATGIVNEIYHQGYVAKRMEIGAVLGAVPLANIRREEPKDGDCVILLGGRTGRDGCGGATGSSKAHKLESLESCGAEVQKGNAPVERKLQRLFRNPKITALILRCNDFGAGGISVAIGELADGICINLSAVLKKYDGLDGTELAISESQERMAVVVEAKDVQKFIALASAENLEATKVAVVTAHPRLVMEWNGRVIVDVSREFLNSNGAEKKSKVTVPVLLNPLIEKPIEDYFEKQLIDWMQDLNRCSQKGLTERFDSTIGAGSVFMPFGGKYQLTPSQSLVMKLPVKDETTTCAGMAFGYNPFISEQNPYIGAYLAVLESVSKLVAAGFDIEDMYLTFQEYFERLHTDPLRWGKPFAALMGALQAQLDLGVAAIGGKDSMSGSFEDLDVPPTLVSFAVAPGYTPNIVSNEFKLPGSKVVILKPKCANGVLPDAENFKKIVKQVASLISSGEALSVYALSSGGIAEALVKMGFGNRIGFKLTSNIISTEDLFASAYGSFIVELANPGNIGTELGETVGAYLFSIGNQSANLAKIQEAYEAKLEPVLPYRKPTSIEKLQNLCYSVETRERKPPKIGVTRPKVLIPVFSGTNCEYDTERAIRRAGGEPVTYIIRNLSSQDIIQSAKDIAMLINQCQMIVLPGGFSGGDEPEGSAKLIAAFFSGQEVGEAVSSLLNKRDGLVLGICNGFQALVKLGLLPYGKVTDICEDMPTLTFNTIGRHQSMLVRTRVASNMSPWLMHEPIGALHSIAISHGEGRFVATKEVLDNLMQNGQVATQYVDIAGEPTMNVQYNPNGSLLAIEGISSPNGRVFGKMGHTERSGESLYINVPGNKYQKLFEGGVDYFKVL